MTIGLILLAAVGIFLFFGGTERFFAKLGLPSRAAFVIVLALVVGAVIPQVNFGNAFNIQLGGFLIPLAVMAIFLFRCNGREELFKAMLSIASVAAVCIAARMLIPSYNAGLRVTISVVTGFVGAAVACIISQSRVPAIAGVLGGMVIADTVTSLVYRFFIDGSTVSLGTAGVFDAIVIGVVFTVLIAEALSAIKKHSRASKQPIILTDLEAGEDYNTSEEDVSNIKPSTYHFNEEDYEEYFNDDID